jgi:hypothetical protein
MKTHLTLIAMMLLAISCTKESGSGGTASLTGRIKVLEYNEDFSQLKATYYAQAENVYLVYGDDQTHSDTYKTTPEGYFTFNYLRKGKYTIYVYSDDSTGVAADKTLPIYVTNEITKNGVHEDLGDITILRSTKWNNGTARISGRIFVRDYNTDFTLLMAQYYGYDEDVFIVQGNNQYYSDDLKTDVDGWYSFESLPLGHYTVYGVSKDSTGTYPGGYYPVKKEVDITQNFQDVVLNDIIILK